MTTVQLCALGARLRDGHASRDDLFLADQIIAAFAGQYPRDGIVQIIEGEISDDIDDNEISA